MMVLVIHGVVILLWWSENEGTMVEQWRRGNQSGNGVRRRPDVERCCGRGHALLLLVCILMLEIMLLLKVVVMPCVHFLLIPCLNLT
jgi:hypothetical protein